MSDETYMRLMLSTFIAGSKVNVLIAMQDMNQVAASAMCPSRNEMP